MKVLSSLIVLALLSGCVDASKDSNSSESSESTEISGNAQVNQPVTTTVAGGGAQVDASNRPENAAPSDSVEQLDKGPCEGIWKGESESDGALAYIGPKGDIIQWSSFAVAAVTEEGEETEYCEYAGLTPEGTQQVWRCSKPGAEYTGSFTIEFDGESCSGSVEEPGARVEL